MGINLKSPTGLSACTLVADSVKTPCGSSDSVASLTKVNGLPISAALEIQSTEGAFVLPRMTTAQVAALNNATSVVTNGMMVYNTDSNAALTYANGSWGTGTSSITVTLTRAQILTLFNANPAVVLIPAPGAGKIIVVKEVILENVFNTTAFANGGDVTIGYGPLAASVIANPAIGAVVGAAFVTSNVSTVLLQYGESNTPFDVAGGANLSNLPICIACAAANFTGGNANSKLKISINYSIINLG